MGSVVLIILPVTAIFTAEPSEGLRVSGGLNAQGSQSQEGPRRLPYLASPLLRFQLPSCWVASFLTLLLPPFSGTFLLCPHESRAISGLYFLILVCSHFALLTSFLAEPLKHCLLRKFLCKYYSFYNWLSSLGSSPVLASPFCYINVLFLSSSLLSF